MFKLFYDWVVLAPADLIAALVMIPIGWGTTIANFLHHYTALSAADLVLWLIVVGPSIVTVLYFFIRDSRKSLRDRTLERMDNYNLDRTPAKLEGEEHALLPIVPLDDLGAWGIVGDHHNTAELEDERRGWG